MQTADGPMELDAAEVETMRGVMKMTPNRLSSLLPVILPFVRGADGSKIDIDIELMPIEGTTC